MDNEQQVVAGPVSFLQKIVGFIKGFNFSRKNLIRALIVVVVIIGAVWLGYKYLKPQPKKVYEALIQVRSQQNSDPAEDAATSLKVGDVIVVLPEGHVWSQTEKVSFLILKMNLNESEAQKLLEPEQKTAVRPKPATDEEKKREAERKKAEGDREQMETVRARRYRIQIEKIDSNFDPNTLLEKQPFSDTIYDWKIVEKKPKI